MRTQVSQNLEIMPQLGLAVSGEKNSHKSLHGLTAESLSATCIVIFKDMFLQICQLSDNT
jgi:hypothetical protein